MKNYTHSAFSSKLKIIYLPLKCRIWDGETVLNCPTFMVDCVIFINYSIQFEPSLCSPYFSPT